MASAGELGNPCGHSTFIRVIITPSDVISMFQVAPGIPLGSSISRRQIQWRLPGDGARDAVDMISAAASELTATVALQRKDPWGGTGTRCGRMERLDGFDV